MPRPKTKAKLATMFTTFCTIEMSIGRRESCIPRNQPFKAVSGSIAGAPQIHILKYARA